MNSSSLVTPPSGLCAQFTKNGIVPLAAMVLRGTDVVGVVVVTGSKTLVYVDSLPDFEGYTWFQQAPQS